MFGKYFQNVKEMSGDFIKFLLKSLKNVLVLSTFFFEKIYNFRFKSTFLNKMGQNVYNQNV